jgi:hypothetical protein
MRRDLVPRKSKFYEGAVTSKVGVVRDLLGLLFSGKKRVFTGGILAILKFDHRAE